MSKSNIKKIMSSAQAINDALKIAGTRDKSVILFGEGINDPASFFGTTKGLKDIYGSKRIIEMPISENALTGIAVGAAVAGKRPVISFHRVEFALLAMEQIINNAAKMHYTSNGLHSAPIIIRLIVGRGWGQGPSHSQSLESMFSAIPGLRVFAPVFPNDYKGMLLAALDDNSPCIFIEHRWTHYIKGEVNNDYYTSDILGPQKINEGINCTVVAVSISTLEAIRAAEFLKKIDVSLDIFDMRVLSPINIDEIIDSVKKTGHLITVDLGVKSYGVGSEIISQLIPKTWGYLKKPPVQIGLPNHPIPSSRGYLENVYPNSKMIVNAVFELLDLKINTEINLDDLDSNTEIDTPNPDFRGPF